MRLPKAVNSRPNVCFSTHRCIRFIWSLIKSQSRQLLITFLTR